MWRLERRPEPSRAWSAAAPLVAVAATMLVASVLVAAAGAPVGAAARALIEGAFGSRFAITETLTRATPLVLTGLAAAVAFRAKLFNIGGEGQLHAGAIAAVAVGGLHGGADTAAWVAAGVPAVVVQAAMLAAAALAGAALLLVPAWLKLRTGADEVVTTLLLNFIVLLAVSALLDGPMKDPAALGWPQSVAIAPEVALEPVVERSRLHSGAVVALGAALGVAVLWRFTTLGFAVRAVGENAAAARYAGIGLTRTTVAVALLSGGLAGLAGAVEVAGRAGYVTLDMATGTGYAGIVIAMLAALHPIGVVLASVFVAAVLVGADSMGRQLAVPSAIADVIVAVALLAMLCAALAATHRLRRR
jgi:simple sugar transport system permease protein